MQSSGWTLGLGLAIGICTACGEPATVPADAFVPTPDAPMRDAPVGDPLTVVVEDRNPAGGEIALQVESSRGGLQRFSSTDGRFEIVVDWSDAPFAFGVSNGIRAVTVAGADRDGIPGFAIVDGTLTIPIDLAPPPRATEGPITIRVPRVGATTFSGVDERVYWGVGAAEYVFQTDPGEEFRFFVASEESGVLTRWAALSVSGVTSDTTLPFDRTTNAVDATTFTIAMPHRGLTTGPDWTRIAGAIRVIPGTPAEAGPWLGFGRGVVSGDIVTFDGAYYDQPDYEVVTSISLGAAEVVGYGSPQSTIYVSDPPDMASAPTEPFLPFVEVTHPAAGVTIGVGQPFQFTADTDVSVQLAVGPAEDQRRWLIHYDPTLRALTIPSPPIGRSALVNVSRSVSGNVRLCDVPSDPESPFECERVSESFALLFGI